MAAIIFIVLFVLMWLVLIVPRQRELRRHQALMAQLEVDDEVMLGAGIYGTIRWLDGDFVGVEVAPHVELKVARRAVAAKIEPSPAVADDQSDAETVTASPIVEASTLDEVGNPADSHDVAGK